MLWQDIQQLSAGQFQRIISNATFLKNNLPVHQHHSPAQADVIH